MILNYINESNTGSVRRVNEDFALVKEFSDGLLAVVCDGIGGTNAGDVASETAADTIREYFVENDNPDIQAKLFEAVMQAHRAVLKKASENRDYEGMGTTAAAVFVNSNGVYTSHIGDSRVYLYSDQQLMRLTKDHSYVQELIDKEVITEAEAEKHPAKNIITRSLGMDEDMMPESSFNPLPEAEWKLLLCTDGVSGVMSDYEIAQALSIENPDDIYDYLISRIEEKGSPDNYTFIVITNREQQ